ncbi:uncharacterized protein LOC141711699 [Apium graveolens]|uniref:uncharacterized protein LOC141711699 n=1 Tax=Apium graveolens TaxID=4045 RepID=UPI003D78CA84
MEGVSSRLGRASSRYGGSAPVFTGPVRKWKKQWVHVSSPLSHSSRSHHHHHNHNNNNNSPSLLLCRWTPVSDKSVKPQPDLPRRKFRYTPIVGIDDLKKEVDKRGKDEAVTSKTSQSSPRETARKGVIFRKQDIDSLFMEVSQASINDQDDSDGEDQ